MSCPADAIKMDENAVVHSSLKPRCIACRNCELSCPFGVPITRDDIQQMQKCDMCFDRTSAGKKPMCCTVCPTGAVFYGTLEEMKALRPHSKPISKWRFGRQVVETRVYVMVPHDVEEMVVDWPVLLEHAEGPFDLALLLKAKYEALGVRPEDWGLPAIEPPPQSATEEAEFL